MQNQSDNKRIDGKSLAETIKNDLKQKVYEMKKKNNTIPCLAVILVGTRADSSTYVRMKKQACLDIGINFILKEFSDTISQNELLTEVLTLNNDESVHGLIVQLPLPSHFLHKSLQILKPSSSSVLSLKASEIDKLLDLGTSPNDI